MLILLAEDSDPLRLLYARRLEARGFDVLQASDGEEALGLLGAFCPDLILTDLMMPGLDGLGLLRRLHEIPEMGSVPVVVMSAVISASAEREAREAGAADFLGKPVDSDELFNRVSNYL
jgi:DNA-binding response OmpR family regulator